MKSEALHHTKMKRLLRRLDIPLWQGVGLLETLWQLTAKQACQGDIGRLTDEDIALGIDYRGDDSFLINTLVESGWLDRHEKHRLVVHDWPDHAPDSVHMKMARAHLYFADGSMPKLSRLSHKERESAQAFYTPDAQINEPCAQNGTLSSPPSHNPPIPSHPITNKQTSISQEPEQAAAAEPEFVRSSPPPKTETRKPIEIPRKSMPSAKPPTTQVLDANKLRWMRSCLHDYMSVDPSGIGPPRTDIAYPRDEVVLKCLEIVAGVEESRVVSFLNERLKAGQRRGRPGGPKDYPWFITVLGTHFQPQALVISRAEGAHA